MHELHKQILTRKGVSKGMKIFLTLSQILEHALRYPTLANVRAAMDIVAVQKVLFSRNNEEIRRQVDELCYSQDSYCQLRILYTLYHLAGFYPDSFWSITK